MYALKIPADLSKAIVRIPVRDGVFPYDTFTALKSHCSPPSDLFETLMVRFSQFDAILLINESGMLLNLPLNHRASMLYGFALVGDVIIVARDELDPSEMRSLSESESDYIEALIS